MQTEPEQWAVELDEQATLAGNKAYVVCEGDDVERGRAAERARQLTIQRAFEERMKNPGYLKGHFFSADPRSQALKDTTHDQ